MMIYFLQIIGVINLSLCMDKHYKVVFGQPSKSQLADILKYSGWFFIITSLILMIQVGGIPLLYWTGFLSFEIILLAIFYSWKSALFKR